MVLQKTKYSKVSSSDALPLGLSFLEQCIVIKWKQWQTLFSWAPKSLQMVAAAMKFSLLLRRKAMTNLDSILKSRDIAHKGSSRQGYGFVMYGCESWTIKKAEHRRIHAFKLWSWRRLLRVLWTVRRSNQSILKEINPEYSLKGLMLKLKLPYFGHLMQSAYSKEKTPMLGKIMMEKGAKKDEMVGWHHELNRYEFEQTLGDGKRQGSLMCFSPCGCKESDTN